MVKNLWETIFLPRDFAIYTHFDILLYREVSIKLYFCTEL